MKFVIEEKVFDALKDACFGVVIAKGIDNQKTYPAIGAMLDENISATEAYFEGKKVKEDPRIVPYREAFLKLNINPNKFMSSIEAMFTRVSKGKGLPRINPIVDLGNALSLKYVLPMGAHDIDKMHADMEVRFSRPGDEFLPFGETKKETLPDNELIYVVKNEVRTRRWTWRQSEIGKIGPETKNVFYPIDGFHGVNKDSVLKAQEELAALCKELLGLENVRTAFLDKDTTQVEL
ncbi:hypothetical protein LJC27_04985 [Christensenellaceae bacterium OttesenSCG-928-M15]|nr:hypothetical protein [Christensenellaceae bacterium OttesenSCG-928-M15]